MTEGRYWLTERELHELEKFLDVACFEIHLEGGDITLEVSYQPASDEGSSYEVGKTIAAVSLQKVVEYDVGNHLDNRGHLDETHANLLAMAGHLRKAADFIEKELKSYENDEWQIPVLPEVPSLLRIVEEDEEDGEKEQGDMKSDESEDATDSPAPKLTLLDFFLTQLQSQLAEIKNIDVSVRMFQRDDGLAILLGGVSLSPLHHLLHSGTACPICQ